MKKKSLLLIISLALGLILFLGTIIKVGPLNIIKTFLSFSLLDLSILLALSLITFLLGVLRWRVILRSFGAQARWKNLILAWLSGYSLSYLTPVINLGGEPVRIYVLKDQEKKLGWHKISASTVIDKALDLTLNLLLIIVGGLFFIINYNIPLLLKIFTFVFILFLISLAYLFYSRAFQKKNYVLPLIKLIGLHNNKTWLSGQATVKKTESLIHNFFQLKDLTFWKVILVTLLRFLFYFLRIILIIVFLYEFMPLANILVIIASIFLISSLPIPGAFGTQEISQAYLFSSLNGGAEIGVAFSLMNRILDLILVGLGLFVIFHFSIKNAIYDLVGWTTPKRKIKPK